MANHEEVLADRDAEIRRLQEALSKAGAFLQSLDLESDYYIDSHRHPNMKSSAIEALAAINQILGC